MSRLFIAPLFRFFTTMRANRGLVLQMLEREVVGRYRGSFLGLAWSFFNPLLMLAIYTFVFTAVFKAKWGGDAEQGRADYAILLFVGLIVHGLMAECVNRAPTLVVSNPNYVKKVIFPLEILPFVGLGSSLFHAAISTVVLLLAQLAFMHVLPWTVILFPLVLLPLLFITIGISWVLASVGVFLRDISHITAVAVNLLLFVSPVFYSASVLPPGMRSLFYFNPLTYIIEASRDVLIRGVVPSYTAWSIVLAVSLVIAYFGFFWFINTKKGFADVL